MVGPNPKIEHFREDEVQPTEDRYLKKEKKPTRDFREVAEQIDEKRYKEEEIKRSDKKAASKKSAAKDAADEPAPSIFDLVRNNKKNSDKEDDEESKSKLEAIDEEEVSTKKTQAQESVKNNPEFIPEHHDLSYVNPLAASNTSAINFDNNPIKSAMPTAPAANIQEIIDRITKEVYSLEMNGKNETVVTLKGPLFDQSRLILSEFDSARGQFNITIDNLTQAAKNMLDLNQNSLIENLSKKGYMVHIVTTTTTIEPTRIDDLAQDNNQNPNQDREQERQGRDSEDQQ